MTKSAFHRRLLAAATMTISLFYAAGAGAADLAPFAAPPLLTGAGFSWDGFYAGLHSGVTLGKARWSRPTGFYTILGDVPSQGDIGATLGGAQAGFNKQFGPLVAGAEADVSFGRFDGNSNCGGLPNPGGVGDICHSHATAIATLAGRLGFAAGNALLFVKAGGAFTRDKYDSASFYLPAFTGSANRGRFGWTLGGGVEYALTRNLSWKAEYAYVDFGRRAQAFAITAFPPGGGWDIARSQQVVKFGLNYSLRDTFLGNGAEAGGDTASLAGDFSGEFGTRTGLSTGNFRKDLYAPGDPTTLNSRLTWTGQGGLSTEGFGRIDHVSGIFAKGVVGGVDIAHAHMHDEDFPPGLTPYSNTRSATRHGRDIYASGDIGYNVLYGDGWKLGAFAGYQFFSQRLNAYGCTQVAANNAICGPGQVPPTQLTLSENEHWQALRVGLAGEVRLTDRIKLSGEAAWLPHMNFASSDNHWLRPNINALKETGLGRNGYQVESLLSYAVTENFDIGVGARYWALRAEKAHVTFPGLPVASPLPLRDNRFGAFVQTTYRFGDAPSKSAEPPLTSRF